MIIKERIIENMRLVWYLKGETIYLIKIKEEEFKIIRKIAPTIKIEQLKKIHKTLLILSISLGSIFTFLKYKEPIDFCLENKEVIMPLIGWESLTDYQKEVFLLEQIDKLLENNPEVEKEEQEKIREGYAWYLPQYAKYMNRINAYETLASSAKVKIEKTQIKKKRNEETGRIKITYGQYNMEEHKIYYARKSSLFHEKIHSDSWTGGVSTYEESMFDEIKASFASPENNSYNDLKSAFSLIEKLIGKENAAKYLTQNKGKEIWKLLEKEFPQKKKEIKELRESLIKVYIEKYIMLEEESSKKDFWENYTVLYNTKYDTNIEEDKMTSYLKENFFENSITRNQTTGEFLKEEELFLLKRRFPQEK